MHKRIFHQLQERIRTKQYVMTLHAEEEMSNDGLTIFDVERAILAGQIIERQGDHRTGEWKYLIAGLVIDGQLAIVVTKLSVTNVLVIITVYLED